MNTITKLVVVGLSSFFFFIAFNANAQTYNIKTIAGNGIAGYSGMGGPATAAELDAPNGMGIDATGNIYSAESGSNDISQVNISGTITVFAGIAGVGGYSGNGGAATAAELDGPIDVTVDSHGNIYISDRYNYVIRMVNTSGIISTVAGIPGVSGYSGNGGQATAAELNPGGVSVNASGDIFIADYGNCVIREVNTNGIISTIAGNGVAGYSGDDGPATSAELNYPIGIDAAYSDNIYFCDNSNNRVRMINTSGIITTVVGNGAAGYSGNGGPATTAELNWPNRLFFDASGNMYIDDYSNECVREVNTSNIISTVAGIGGIAGYSGDGGPATAAEFNNPDGITVNSSGNIYIDDQGNDRIRELYVPCSFSAAAAVIQNVLCNGQSNGSASVNASGGSSPYTYTWAPSGGNAAEASGLSAGVYTVSVVDNNGCTGTGTVTLTITQPTALSASAGTTANVSCYGGINGSTTSSISGGTMPYSYSWSNGVTNSDDNGLSAGVYTLTVTDNNGCSATASANVTQPALLAASIEVTAGNACNGGSDGVAISSVSGGTSPYDYLWSSTSSSIGTNTIVGGLSAGTYTLYVTDNNGCSASATASISQPTPIIPTITENTYIACNGESDAVVFATATGGTGFYSYLWSDGSSQNNATATGLSAGVYTLTVTDNSGCTATASITITQPASAVGITISSVTNATCNGDMGSVTAEAATGGTPPYTYLWLPGGETSLAATLSAGNYTITATDNNRCTATTSATITQPAAMDVEIDSINVTVSAGNCGGEIAATVISGGVAPYTYSWFGGQTTDTIQGQCAGSYCVEVIDANGCTQTSCVNIVTGIQDISYSSNITVYPDPNSGLFTVTGIKQGQLVNLYNYLGQEIFSRVVNNYSNMQFDISTKANGIYLIRVENKDGSIATEQKILKTQ